MLRLNSEALAALGATAGEHGTASLGRHTGTEAMALRTLTSVRLVGALHVLAFHTVFRATVRLYYGRFSRQESLHTFKSFA